MTDAGRELAAAVRKARAAEADRAFAGLPDADRAELERLLRQLLVAWEPDAAEDSAAGPH